MATLVERMRTAREKTGRKSMLLSADYATRHRSSVLAYDAANEIGLGIVIARPQAPQGPAPAWPRRRRSRSQTPAPPNRRIPGRRRIKRAATAAADRSPAGLAPVPLK